MYLDWQGNLIDVKTWAKLFSDQRHIGEDMIGDVYVSTVWIGIDHNFFDKEGPPLIFETMVFGGSLDENRWRWATEAEARAGHVRTVELVRLEQGVTAEWSDL